VFTWPFNYHYYGELILFDPEKTLPGGVEAFIYIMTTFLTSLIGYGTYVFFLKLVRGEVRSYSDLFYYFKNGQQFVRAILVTFFVTLFTVLWSLLLIIPGIIKSLAYSQVGYILKDNPTMKPLDAITLSRRMMDGYKWKLFLLGLSFIGWVFVVIITLGLGVLYVAPYYTTTLAQFHEEIKAAYEEKNETI
jgi:uncharacterized membrane protein